MTTSTFESRLARMADELPAHLAIRIAEPEPVEDIAPSGPGLLKWLLVLPLAAALGAGSVMLGGIVQVALIDGGLTGATPIPPQLGYAAFGIAFVLSFLIDKLMGGGIAAPLAVTAGFVAMIWGEVYLAEMYPEVWIDIYNAKYLTPIQDMLANLGA